MSLLGKWEVWSRELSKPTSIFGLKVWIVVGICAGALVALLLSLLSILCSSSFSSRRTHKAVTRRLAEDTTPTISKEIPEVVRSESAAAPPAEIRIDLPCKGENRVVFGDYLGQKGSGSASGGGESRGVSAVEAGKGAGPPEVSHLGWGHWYTLRELEEATGWLSPENVIGEGGYGIVYRGVLGDGTVVAVKNLLNNRGQAEREFKVEVEAIGRVRHKNLVRLLGYCAEGAYRMLVYEYIDNGNLDYWLHGDVGQVSPLTWEIRMSIILGTAKGLAYLHEGLEPKVVHRDVKSSNILLDTRWHPKVSDFGLAKLLCSENNHVTTRVMGTFGYVAPEYASTGMLTERSDIYSFGVLIMEIISGRAPVDYNRPRDEVHLVEWLKNLVGDRRTEEVLDSRIPEKPSPKALKRAVLVALRCVDPDARKRPKMGHIIHMLEMDDLLFRDEQKSAREESPGLFYDVSKRTLKKQGLNDGERKLACAHDPQGLNDVERNGTRARDLQGPNDVERNLTRVRDPTNWR